jgi:hypothetical protein
MKYHKINTVFKRDTRGKITDEFVDSINENVLAMKFIGTEKIDGTNIRVYFKNNEIEFRGRSDNAQIPPRLLKKLSELFTLENLTNCFGEDANVVLYGEGYGAKIQKGGGDYIRDNNNFILFDVSVFGEFNNTKQYIQLQRLDVLDIADKLDIRIVPIVFEGSLLQAIDFVKDNQKSNIAQTERLAEGIVITPIGDFRDRMGNRMIYKVKIKDFK